MKKDLLPIIASLVALLACLAACSTKFKSGNEDGDGDGVTEDDPSIDHDAIDTPAEEVVMPCDQEEVPDEAGIFVTPSSGGNDGNSGDSRHPLKTIAAAVSLARTMERTLIYLDEGTYGEKVELRNLPLGVTLIGGWKLVGLEWQRSCDAGARGRTLIASPDTVGVLVEDVTAPSGLAHLTVSTAPKGPTPVDGVALSRIAVLVIGENSSFHLLDVSLQPGDGDDGGLASAGYAGEAPTCDGKTDCAGGSIGGAGVAGGDASGQGVFEGSLFVPADGEPGQSTGDAGLNGTVAESVNSPVSPCNVGCNCGAGCNSSDTVSPAPALGKCGCGGQGGGPGRQGHGGGASVALLVVGAMAVAYAEYSELAAGNGGAGSAGGEGGPGAEGTPGAAETQSCHTGGCDCAAGTCPSGCLSCYYNDSHSGDPGPTLYTSDAGGRGGNGGPGGVGGAGAGGPSYAVVTVGGARFVDGEGNALDPGTGGESGGGTAPIGRAAEIFDQP
jgi:hypothetical protein